MKTIVKTIAVLLLVAAAVFAAGVASYNNRTHVHNIGAVTIDGQQTGTWDSITTHIDTAKAGLLVDSTQYIIRFSGIASMNPGAKLFFGVTRADSGDVDRGRDLDSGYIAASASLAGAIDIPFTWEAFCQSDSAHIDTFFFNMASGGSSNMDYVKVRGLKISVTQLTQDR